MGEGQGRKEMRVEKGGLQLTHINVGEHTKTPMDASDDTKRFSPTKGRTRSGHALRTQKQAYSSDRQSTVQMNVQCECRLNGV
jgi:hypothetical protein